MRTYKLLLILAVTFLVSSIMTVIVVFATGYRNDFKKYRETIDFQETASLSGINSINIKASIAKLNVIPTDDDEVSVSFTGERYSLFKRSETSLVVETKDEMLNIRVEMTKPRNSMFNFFNWTNDLKLNVYLPKTYQEDLSINVTTGSVNVGNFTLNNFSYQGSTGSLDFDRVTFNKGVIKSSTGSVEGTVLWGDLDVSLTTGDVDIVHLGSEFDIDINVTTGNVELTLLQDAKFDLDISVTVGDIECEFPVTNSTQSRNKLSGYVNESGVNSVKIRTTTGSVEIEQR